MGIAAVRTELGEWALRWDIPPLPNPLTEETWVYPFLELVENDAFLGMTYGDV